MDRRRRERTKKIFGLLQSDENTQKQSDSDINSPAQNNRRPSRPRPYEDGHQSLKMQNPALKRQRRPTVKVQKSPDKEILNPDFDDDDSVDDITYDPLIAGDFSSSDEENELLSKVKKVKRQLFTPIKKGSKKILIPHDSVVTTVQAETDRTNQILSSHDYQTNDELITPEDLGFDEELHPPSSLRRPQMNNDDDINVDEELRPPGSLRSPQINTHNDIIIDKECRPPSLLRSPQMNNNDDVNIDEELRPPGSLRSPQINTHNDIIIEKECRPPSSLRSPPINNNDDINVDEELRPSSLLKSPQINTHEDVIIDEESRPPSSLRSPQINTQDDIIVDEQVSTPSPQMNRTRPTENSSTKKNPRKRSRNINKWKKTIAKTKRLRGLSYISITKKQPEIRARELKPPCQESCRKKSYEKLTEKNRTTLFTQFWKNTDSWDQRRQYIANNIKVSLKKYMKTTSTIEKDRRKFTHNYTIPMKTGNITTVCKTMFLNTFDISEKFVRICLAKTLDSGLVTPDQRGHHIPANKTSEHIVESVVNHISSYPSYQSHYNRENTNRKFLGPELNICTMYKQYVELMKDQNKEEEDIAKSWLYREIFNTKFNLSFKLLEMDTCDDCDRFQRKILDTTSEEEKETVVAQKNTHLEEAERRYNLKKADKENCYKNTNTRVLFLDLQKCLPTPFLTNTQSFYLRKLWTLNLTIYEASEKKSFNYVWPENLAGRGGNEIGSCMLKWAETNLKKEVTETITWTDNCQGQNRNIMLVLTYLWLMEKYPHVKTMKHKFLLKGHTHMEVDHVHSIIERKKKTLNTMEIAVPRDWAQFLRSCSGKNVFQVTEMVKDDFKDLTALTKKTSGPFVTRKKNTAQNDFKISETVVWKFDRRKPGTLFYKTDFTQESYYEVDLVRKVGKSFKCPESIPNIRETEKPISTAKYNDLMTLLQWVPKDFHCYYQNLKHTDNASDLPEI